MVVTDLSVAGLEDAPVCQLLPSAENRTIDTWWALSPRFIVQFLGILGFRDTAVTAHEARYRGRDFPLYTVVGRR